MFTNTIVSLTNINEIDKRMLSAFDSSVVYVCNARYMVEITAILSKPILLIT